MKKITRADIQNLHDYELARPETRQRVIERKKRRRVALGPLVSLVFENRATVLFQIQEMLRAERIVEPPKVQEEIDVYNSLLPDPGEVSATLFIEVTDESRVKPILDSFIGLDSGRSLWLEVGSLKIPASFEAGHGRQDKISAVHYVRFRLGEEGVRALSTSRSARLSLEHGEHRAEAEITGETIEELLEELSAL